MASYKQYMRGRKYELVEIVRRLVLSLVENKIDPPFYAVLTVMYAMPWCLKNFTKSELANMAVACHTRLMDHKQ